jgi:hypothetical protein
MERIRLAHPFRRSLVLALLIAVPLTGGALTLGAHPVSMFVGGTVVAIAGALLFGGVVRWLPPLAFALVILPSGIAGAPVYGWPAAILLSMAVGVVALLLFYRPTPPEPPRPRPSPYARREQAHGHPYGAGYGSTPDAPRHDDGRRD